jgi:hypothetical protein
LLLKVNQRSSDEGRTVKSFRLYLPEPPPIPVRVVTDYTPDELLAFRERFRPLADHYKRRCRVASFGAALFVLCLILCIILPTVLPKHLSVYFWVAGICVWLFAFLAAPLVPECPACHNKLDAAPGPFCPECGSRSVKTEGWFRLPRCESCGKSLTKGKGGRRYKIRACTHCGVRLDERGL